MRWLPHEPKAGGLLCGSGSQAAKLTEDADLCCSAMAEMEVFVCRPIPEGVAFLSSGIYLLSVVVKFSL